MSLLDAALAYAASGRYVFPVESRGKRPLGRLVPNGSDDATTDADQIRAWWTAAPDANIGISLEPSGLVALDVDVSGEKQGAASLATIDAELTTSLTAHTGSGGLHVVYSRPEGVRAGRRINFLPGLDLLGKGYIVAAPSVHASGGVYRWHDAGAEIVPLPARLAREAGAVRPERDRPIETEERTLAPSNVRAKVLRALRVHGPAISGEGGNNHTYQAACIVVNDYALPEEQAFEVLSAWNKFNDPEWTDEELWTFIHNAGKHASGETGLARATVETKALLLGAGDATSALGLPARPEPGSWEAELEQACKDVLELLANEGEDGGAPRELFESAANVVARPKLATRWRVQGLMVKGGTTMLSGGPKTSKTWAEIELFIAMTTGTPAFGQFPVPEACRAALFLAEDDAAGFTTRLAATAIGRGTPLEVATKNLFVQPRGRTIDLTKLEDVALVVASCRKLGGVDVVGLDPLRDIHSGEEDKSDAMSVVMRHVRAIGTLLKADTFLVHHSKKPSENGSRSSGGQQMRGSSSIHGSVDNGIYIVGVSGDKVTTFTNKMESQVKAGRSAGVFDLTLTIEDDEHGNATRAVWTYVREDEKKADATVKRNVEMEADVFEIMKRYPGGTSRTALKADMTGKSDVKVRVINALLKDGRLYELSGRLFVKLTAGITSGE